MCLAIGNMQRRFLRLHWPLRWRVLRTGGIEGIEARGDSGMLFRSVEDLAIGRALVEAGAKPDGLCDRLRMVAWSRLGPAIVEAERRPLCLKAWRAVYLRGGKRMSGLITADTRKKMISLDETLREAKTEIATAKAAGNDLVALATMATYLDALRKQFDEQILGMVKPLMNSKLGFQTDRDPAKGYQGGPYPDETIRDALLSGGLQGARFHGNEINIISGGLYLTREFYERMFCELEGVSHLEPPSLGIPRETALQDKKYATINARLRFKLHGKQLDLDFSGERAIVVVWNKGMSVDSLHGKARKRIYKYAHGYVTGTTFLEQDDTETVEGQVLIEAGTTSDKTAEPPTEEADQAIDLQAEAAAKLKKCKTIAEAEECVRRSWDEEGVDIRELGELKKQALQTVGNRGKKTE